MGFSGALLERGSFFISFFISSPAVDLPLPPASILLPDVGDDLTHADRQLIVVLGLVVKLHYGLHHWRRAGPGRRGSVKVGGGGRGG